jgi:hypothetical protein
MLISKSMEDIDKYNGCELDVSCWELVHEEHEIMAAK